jgi:hypothetical protein
MGMLELVVRSRLGRDGIIRTSSSLVTHKNNGYKGDASSYNFIIFNLKGRYSSKVEQLYVAQYIPVQLRISSLYLYINVYIYNLYIYIKLG